MKNALSKVVLTGILILAANSASFAATEVATKITDVTVYKSGATVTRSANLQLAAGESRVKLIGLPANLNMQGLQIEIDSPQISMGQVSLSKMQLRDTIEQSVKSIKDQIAASKLKLSEIDDRIKSAKLQISFLKSLANIGTKSDGANISSLNSQQVLTLIGDGSDKAYRKIRESELKKTEVIKDLDLLNRKLRDAQKGSKSSKTLDLHVASEATVNTPIRVRYFQKHAYWTPKYEAKLNSDGGKLLLEQKAIIEQNTSEVWENVKVELSTSQPSDEMSMPEVGSQFLSLEPEYGYANKKMSRAYNQAPMADEGVELEQVVVTASRIPQPKWSGNYAVNYQIPGRITVRNGRAESQGYDLKKFSFDVELVTRVAPVLSTQAFLTANFTYDEKAPLFGEEMTVFVDGTLMGTAEMPDLLPGSEVYLPMGQDKRIDVTVVDQAAKNKKSGVFKRQQVDAIDLTFSIVNRRAVDNKVEVVAVYPVSKDQKVKVERNSNITKATKEDFEDQKGVVMWSKNLAPNKKWDINYGFKISYPANREISRDY